MIVDIRKDNGKLKILNEDLAKLIEKLKELRSTESISSSISKLWYGDASKIQTEVPLFSDIELTSQLQKISDIQNDVNAGIDTWDDYNSGLRENQKWIADWVNETNGQVRTLDSLRDANIRAREAVIENNKAIEAQGLKAKIASIGLKGLSLIGNAIGGFLIGLAISAVMNKINSYINRVENAKESLSTFRDEVEKSKQDLQDQGNFIEENAEKYKRLADGVDEYGRNVSLTAEEFSEYNDITNKIAEMFPSMVKGYSDEGNAIIKLKGNVEALTKAYEENQESHYNNIIKDADGLWKDFQNATNTKGLFGSVSTKNKLLQKEALEQYIKNNQNKAKTQMVLRNKYTDNQVSGALKKAGVDTNDTSYEALQQNKAILNTLITEINAETSSIIPVIDAFLNLNNSDYKNLSDETRIALDSFISSLDASFLNSFDSISEAVSFISKNIVLEISNNEEVEKALNEMFTLDKESIPVSEYVQQARSYIKTLQDAFDKTGDRLNVSAILDVEDDLETSEELIRKVKEKFISSLSNVGGQLTVSVNASDAEKEIDNFINTLNAQDLKIIASPDFVVDEKSVRALKKALEDAKNKVDEFSIPQLSYSTSNLESAIKLQESLNNSLKESSSGAGLSAENLSAISAKYGEALEYTANGIHLNVDALNELQHAEEKEIKLDFAKDRARLTAELAKTEQKLKDYARAEEEAARNGRTLTDEELKLQQAYKNKKESLNSQLDLLEQLRSQYYGLTSAYQKWLDAQSNGEEGDMYDTITEGYKKAEELVSKGLIGTNEFRAYVDLVSGKDLSSAAAHECYEEWQKLKKTVSSLFTEGSAGCERFLRKVQNLNSEWAGQTTDGGWWFNFDDDLEVAEALGVSLEGLEAIMKKLKDYGFEVNIDNLSQTTSDINILKQAIEDTQAEMTKLEKSGKVDTTEYRDAAQKLSDCIISLNQLEGISTSVDIDVQITDIDSKIAELKKQIAACNKDIALGIDVETNTETINQAQAQIDNLENRKIALQQVLSVTLDVDTKNSETALQNVSTELGNIEKAVDEVSAKEIGDLGTPATISRLKNVVSAMKDVNNYKISNKSFNITANVKTVKKKKKKNSKSNDVDEAVDGQVDNASNFLGTALASGTFNLPKNWSSTKTVKSLTGELGRELIVRGNHWFTVGDNGPEFTEIKKGDIIFNHKQTKELLSSGHTNIKGHYVGNENAFAYGTAYSDGTNPIGFVGNSGSSSKKPSSSSSSNSSSKDKKEEFLQVFDWIEIMLDRINDKFERYINAAQNAVSIGFRNGKIEQAFGTILTLVNKNNEAIGEYQKKLNSIELPKEYINKIKDGSLQIEEIKDEKLAEKIQDYQDWYEKLEDCKNTIIDLNSQLRELSQQKLDNIEEYFDPLVEHSQSKQSRKEAEIDLKETIGKNLSSSDYSYLIDKENDVIKDINAERANYQKTYIEEKHRLESVLAKQVKDKLITSEEMTAQLEQFRHKYAIVINGFDQELIESKARIAQWQDDINNISLTSLENKITNLKAVVSRKEANISKKEALGKNGTKKDYNYIISNNTSQVTNIEKINKLLKQLQHGCEKGSTKWQEYQEQIDSNREAIIDLNISTINYMKTIASSTWDKANEKVERYSEKIDLLTAKMDNLATNNYKDKNSYLTKISKQYTKNIEIQEKAVNNTVAEKKNVKSKIKRKWLKSSNTNEDGTLKTD